MSPTLYLSNWSSARTPGQHGPGRKLSAMRRPRAWEHGDGCVVEAMPSTAALQRAKDGEWSWDEYAAHLRSVWGSPGNSGSMAPGRMGVWSGSFARRPYDVVRDGDTLCCACARGGPCHLQIVAEFAHAQGWRVILWGEEWPKRSPRQGRLFR